MAEQPTDVQEVIETPVEGEETPETESPEGAEETPPTKEQVEQLEKDKKGLTEQLIAQRTKTQVAEAKLNTVSPTPVKEEEEGEKDETEVKVLNILQGEKDKEREGNTVNALEAFQKEHPEFNPENDISGLRMDGLNRKLQQFNMQGLTSVSEILSIYEDAYKLTQENNTSTEEKVDMGEEATIPSATQPPKAADVRLSPEEETIRQEKGWSVEKYLKIKEEHPDIIAPFKNN